MTRGQGVLVIVKIVKDVLRGRGTLIIVKILKVPKGHDKEPRGLIMFIMFTEVEGRESSL